MLVLASQSTCSTVENFYTTRAFHDMEQTVNESTVLNRDFFTETVTYKKAPIQSENSLVKA